MVNLIPGKIKPNVELIKEIELFRSFSKEELAQLIVLSSSYRYEAHTNIIIEGEMTWALYLILDGVVGVYKKNKLTGNDYDVGQLHAGNFFGEMSLIDDNPRSATVKSLTECELFCITKEGFTNFLNNSPRIKTQFYENCIKNLIRRIRELDDNFVVSQYQLWGTTIRNKGEFR